MYYIWTPQKALVTKIKDKRFLISEESAVLKYLIFNGLA